MISYFKSRFNALLLWCNAHQIVGFKLAYFIAIAFLITSTPLLYILLKKPGYYKKVFDEITAKETVQTSFKHKLFNTVFTLIFACCFCICISAWVCFIIFTLLFIGLWPTKGVILWHSGLKDYSFWYCRIFSRKLFFIPSLYIFL